MGNHILKQVSAINKSNQGPATENACLFRLSKNKDRKLLI